MEEKPCTEGNLARRKTRHGEAKTQEKAEATARRQPGKTRPAGERVEARQSEQVEASGSAPSGSGTKPGAGQNPAAVLLRRG